MRGKHQKVKSLLGDEDIYQMITEYLWICAWLKHFGWEFCVERKDVYYNSHKRPDVIEYRQDFLNEILELEKWMPKPLDDIMTLEKLVLDVNEKCYILITHNESIFYANDGKKNLLEIS
ncbi:6222_t:CDS:2 [Funneliformis caledonium]|uniref:6222_t:CDS:1 n=1 Tax=Funneliformis caledonium TaxID=1117310 RepID=A0A9N9DBS6_9GLOM|nr:6222_t:CDS:2 [Funneliformis caledonium]